jgi:4,5-dihydroxyphthalate decarboxylase
MSAPATAQTLTLRTAFDTYPHTEAIKSGALRSPRLAFDFVEVKPMHKAFKPMVEHLEYDVSEMAITTYVQARAYGKRLSLLPIIQLNRFHHGSIFVAASSTIKDPKKLDGTNVGVRAYTQTTGVWVRGILATQYGVDNDSITWITTEGGHVAEYAMPGNVVSAPDGANLAQMLRDGEIAAWIGGREGAKEEGIKPLIGNAAAVEREWFERTGIFPINHVLTVKTELLEQHPWLAGELFELFKQGKARYIEDLKRTGGGTNTDEQAKAKLLTEKGIDPLPFGVDAMRRSLECVIAFAYDQHLIPRRFSVDELFDPPVDRLRS